LQISGPKGKYTAPRGIKACFERRRQPLVSFVREYPKKPVSMRFLLRVLQSLIVGAVIDNNDLSRKSRISHHFRKLLDERLDILGFVVCRNYNRDTIRKAGTSWRILAHLNPIHTLFQSEMPENAVLAKLKTGSHSGKVVNQLLL